MDYIETITNSSISKDVLTKFFHYLDHNMTSEIKELCASEGSMLINAEIEAHATGRQSALSYALSNPNIHYNTIKLLLAMGADCAYINGSGNNLLHLVSKRNGVDVIELLPEIKSALAAQGRDVKSLADHKNNQGRMPFFCCNVTIHLSKPEIEQFTNIKQIVFSPLFQNNLTECVVL